MTHGLGVQNAQSLSDVTVILKENCQVPFLLLAISCLQISIFIMKTNAFMYYL
jgi:hypothetical protein